MSLIYFILCCYGMTQILVYGSIFDSVRPDTKFFHCPMCVGFWVGVFLWSINAYTELFIFDYNIVTGFLMGCLSSGTSYIFSMLFGDEGLKMEIKK